MSATLRGVLLIGAFVSVLWITKKIYKSKVKLADAIFWVCMATLFAILGIFPQIAEIFSRIVGIETPVNFVFLFIIILLTEKLFTLSIKVSQLEDKITILSAELALRSHDAENRIKAMKEKDRINE